MQQRLLKTSEKLSFFDGNTTELHKNGDAVEDQARTIGNVLIVVLIAVSVSTLICILAIVYKRCWQRRQRRSGQARHWIPAGPSLSRPEAFIQEIACLDTPPAYDDLFNKDIKFCFDPPTYMECLEKTQYGSCNCHQSLDFSAFAKNNCTPRSARYFNGNLANPQGLDYLGLTKSHRSPKSSRYNSHFPVRREFRKGSRLPSRVTFDQQATVHSLENFQTENSARPSSHQDNNQLTVQSLYEVNYKNDPSRLSVTFDHQATVHSLEGLDHFRKSRSPSPRRFSRFVTTPSQISGINNNSGLVRPQSNSSSFEHQNGDLQNVEGTDNLGFVDIRL